MPGGLICVKENVTKGGVDLDAQDSSVTRYHKRVVAKKLGFRLKCNKRLLLSFLFTKQWTPETERGHARFTSAQSDIFFFNFSHLLLSLMLRLIRHIFQSFQLDDSARYWRIGNVYPQKCPLCFTKQSKIQPAIAAFSLSKFRKQMALSYNMWQKSLFLHAKLSLGSRCKSHIFK